MTPPLNPMEQMRQVRERRARERAAYDEDGTRIMPAPKSGLPFGGAAIAAGALLVGAVLGLSVPAIAGGGSEPTPGDRNDRAPTSQLEPTTPPAGDELDVPGAGQPDAGQPGTDTPPEPGTETGQPGFIPPVPGCDPADSTPPSGDLPASAEPGTQTRDELALPPTGDGPAPGGPAGHRPPPGPHHAGPGHGPLG